VIAPLVPFNSSPAGSAPVVTVHVYGDVPPDADSVALNAVPTRPGGSDVVVIVNSAGAIVSVIFAFVLCEGLLESLTVNVNAAALAEAVGVPEITPVPALRARPRGSPPPVNLHA
jgi:hypothetical protein